MQHTKDAYDNRIPKAEDSVTGAIIFGTQCQTTIQSCCYEYPSLVSALLARSSQSARLALSFLRDVVAEDCALVRDLAKIRILWLLALVPIVLAGEGLWPNARLFLFFASVAAIVPLAVLLSKATESVAHRTGDSIGGLLNATLGNLTEFVIAFTALKMGDYTLVKASIAGAVVTNTLFMVGGCFLIGGLKTHIQEFNRSNARFQASLLFLAVIALLTPSLIGGEMVGEPLLEKLSMGLSVILIAVYALGMLFSLGTHRGVFASADHEPDGALWPLSFSLGILAGATILVALVSEVFVSSVEVAASGLGLSEAFVGFIVVSLVGASAEMATAFAAAKKNRLDLSISIALGSAAQIALFVAPSLVLLSYAIGPRPMTLQFWPGVVAMILLAITSIILVTNSGRSAWFFGAMILSVYAIFAWALFLIPV